MKGWSAWYSNNHGGSSWKRKGEAKGGGTKDPVDDSGASSECIDGDGDDEDVDGEEEEGEHEEGDDDDEEEEGAGVAVGHASGVVPGQRRTQVGSGGRE